MFISLGLEVTVAEKTGDENKDDLQRIINNQLLLDDIDNIEQIDLDTLNTAFQLIPLKTDNAEHKIIVNKIISVFAVKFISGDREDKIDYTVRHGVLKKIAYFLLSSPKEELQGYLKPFLDKFNGSEAMAELFEEFVVAEDHLNSYEIFWEIWNLFKEKVIEICGKGDGYWYIDKIIKKYLFAIRWKESATEWHTLKDENKRFFKEISQKLRHCPSALYAISKLLNDIGSSYLDDGIFWLSNMLKNNENLLDAKLEINTIYYLENNVRKYIYKNREKIKKTIELKQNVLIILEFLIKRGSVIGYILRENIL
ncbi:hypothetical protein JW933_00845 [candidate division FCPU426 bacterium]|nr:hypothetical protein [candidate division FCPU426 bacterium]